MIALLALGMALAAEDATLVDVAGAEAAEGDVETARALLEWAGEHYPALAQEAHHQLSLLPPPRMDWRAATRLTGWQTMLGAWVLGPNVALNTSRYVHPNLTLGGMVLGGALGAGASIVYADRTSLTPGRSNAIIASQQLGVWNGVALSVALDDTRFGWPAGVAAGAVLGSTAGYLVASRNPDGGRMMALHSGAFWGLGLTSFMLAAAPELQGDLPLATVLAIGTDLGAAAGYGLGVASSIERDRVWLVNLGGAIGVAGFFTIAGITSAWIWWEEPGLFTGAAAGALIGGAVAYAVSDGAPARPAVATGALISGQRDDVQIGVPLPTAWRSDDGWSGSLQLVDYRF